MVEPNREDMETMTKFLAFVGLLAILGAIAAAIFFFGGYYNVAGTAAEPKILDLAGPRCTRCSFVTSHVRSGLEERRKKLWGPGRLAETINDRSATSGFAARLSSSRSSALPKWFESSPSSTRKWGTLSAR
jgi:hypothetical protein